MNFKTANYNLYANIRIATANIGLQTRGNTMEKPKFPYEKLIKLDDFAKSLGLTIYDITYGFIENGKETKHGICSFNVQPQEDIPEFKGFVECLRQKYKDKKQAD